MLYLGVWQLQRGWHHPTLKWGQHCDDWIGGELPPDDANECRGSHDHLINNRYPHYALGGVSTGYGIELLGVMRAVWGLGISAVGARWLT